MNFYDAFLGIGRTNGAISEQPLTAAETLALMDRHDVGKAMVFHNVTRDCDVELGNGALAEIDDKRLVKTFGLETACVLSESAEDSIRRGIENGARAFLVNPMNGAINPARSKRLAELADVLQKRRIPLFLYYRAAKSGQDCVDWYVLSDFCRQFPDLPVVVTEFRCRSNRALFDALAETKNLIVSVACLWQHQMIGQVAASFGAKRLVFSMGLPDRDPGSFQMPVIYAGLSDQDRDAIAFENLERLITEANYERS